MPERKPFQRLPQTVIPVNYALSFKPDLNALTFSGSEEISVEVILSFVTRPNLVYYSFSRMLEIGF